jgi:squalene-hopene/tetraprenyl-beta-curcumene cyclase
MKHRFLALLLAALVPAAALAGEARPPEKALEEGIAWLRSQQKDGVWMLASKEGPAPSAGFTAVALTPYLRSLPADARGKDEVARKSIAWLLSKVGADGAVSDPLYKGYENYLTSSVLMALSVLGDPAHEEVREKMKKYLLSVQRREEGRLDGGFGYNKQEGADLSNAQYTIEALRAAGIPEDHEAMVAARRYLERCQNRSENESNTGAKWEVPHEKGGKVTAVPGDDGSAGYEPGVSKAGLLQLPDGTFVARGYGSMTYALLKCYILTGLSPEDERVKAAVAWLAKNYTWDENPGFRDFAKENPGKESSIYFGLYYYYMTAAKALRAAAVDRLGGHDWRKDLAEAIAKRQQADGSWVNDTQPRWEEGSPVLCSAYATIALQEILAQ